MRSRLVPFLAVAVAAVAALRADNHNTYPLPEERGTAGIMAALQKLPVYVRVLYTEAHPDDESASTLTWLARKAHARTALFSLTRGDGGQNVLGDEKYEAMGLVRTGELLEACRIYGVETYFSTAFEFGFSKTADETLSKWGHEATLEEVVRFIRIWRPAIIISSFNNDASGGHGHHQVAGKVTFEAFRAAGDPGKFPNQGLAAWQAKKLYYRSGRGGAAGATVEVPVGDYDPVLGRSFREIGAEGYSKHRSQGNGAGAALPGRSSDSYTLADSTLGKKERESGFFESIDTSLQAILELAGDQREAASFLSEDLAGVQKTAEEALRDFRPSNPAECALKIAKGSAILAEAMGKLAKSALPQRTKDLLAGALAEKQRDFNDAVNATLGIYAILRADEATAAPGQKLTLTAYLFNRGSASIDPDGRSIRMPEPDWSAEMGEAASGPLAAGGMLSQRITVSLPGNARPAEPFWYREGPTDNRYRTSPTPDVFAPFDYAQISFSFTYLFGGTKFSIAAPAMAQAGSALHGSDFVEFQVVPALSISIKPELAVVPLSKEGQSREFHVSILNNRKDGARGSARLILPAGWRAEPAESPFTFSRKGESFTARFTLHVPAAVSGSFVVEAVATAEGREYRRGYRVISYPENWTRNLYAPANSGVRAIDVKIAPGLSVGYIPGAGDEVPEALQQLGAKVQMLSGDDLAFADLSRFNAIVTGVRAYNVNDGLRADNRRLLDYVEKGGVLIVQYVRPLGRAGSSGAAFPFGPYSMSNSDEDRITVEESPMEILDPNHPVFNTPNKITSADFDGWVQERGLYFMREWDSHYTPLLTGHDPGEGEKKGGMLVARYGKGWYVYTAYAWFRQLPAGVPGAFRIFANMLSLGKN